MNTKSLSLLILISLNTLANTNSNTIDISNMSEIQVYELISNMSKKEFMSLYRHYNQAVLDLWHTGNYEYSYSSKHRPDKDKYYTTCHNFDKIKFAAEYLNKITSEEKISIDKENKDSSFKICMYAPAFPSNTL